MVSVTTCFVTKAKLMHRKLHYVSKCNKLVQLVVQVKYHVNVIYSLKGGHTHKHTDFVGKNNFKKPGMCQPGLKRSRIDLCNKKYGNEKTFKLS